jgi:hypothetical protein
MSTLCASVRIWWASWCILLTDGTLFRLYLLTAPTRNARRWVLLRSAKNSLSAYPLPKLSSEKLVQNCPGIIIIYSKVLYELCVRVPGVINTQILVKIGFGGSS